MQRGGGGRTPPEPPCDTRPPSHVDLQGPTGRERGAGGLALSPSRCQDSPTSLGPASTLRKDPRQPKATTSQGPTLLAAQGDTGQQPMRGRQPIAWGSWRLCHLVTFVIFSRHSLGMFTGYWTCTCPGVEPASWGQGRIVQAEVARFNAWPRVVKASVGSAFPGPCSGVSKGPALSEPPVAPLQKGDSYVSHLTGLLWLL